MYSVLTPASLKQAEETLLWLPELLFYGGGRSCFVLFLFSYCFVDTCKHLNIFFPQNCPIRATSEIRSLTVTVSFKSFSSKSFSRILNNGTITDALEFSLRRVISSSGPWSPPHDVSCLALGRSWAWKHTGIVQIFFQS